MRLAIPCVVALWVSLTTSVVLSASVKNAEPLRAKRDVAEVFPAIFAGAVDMTLDLLDRFGKGFAIRGSSKTDGFGLHDEKNFEAGTGDAITGQLEREKRSAVPCNNATNTDAESLTRTKRSAQNNPTPPNGPPPNGPPPNGPPPNGPPPNGPPPNGPPPNGPPPNASSSTSNADDTTQSQKKVKRSALPCRNATNTDAETLTRTTQGNATPPNGPRPNASSSNSNRNLNTENVRVKRDAKPCNGQPNGQPNGAPTNNFPQLPQQPTQQQPQQLPQTPTNAGVNIADLQRDQNQRLRRSVNDPDKVVPSSNVDDKNLFERIVQVAKEVVARVTRWVDDMDKEQATANPKGIPEKPKL